MDSLNGGYESATLPTEDFNHTTRRPRGSAGPSYVRSVFTDSRVRALVAGYLEQQVAELNTAGAGISNADAFISAQLDDVINELRGVS